MFGDTLGERIARIGRLPSENTAVLVWKESTDGRFTVKRGYEASQAHGPSIDSKLWKKVWSPRLHFRHSMMLWRVISDCLPTKERLVFVRDKICSMCGEETESDTHLFWDCHCAWALWFGSPFSSRGGVGNGNSIKERLVRLLESIPRQHTASFLSFVRCLFEGIWKARNELLFKGGVVDILQIRDSIMRRHSKALRAMKEDSDIGVTTPTGVIGKTVCNTADIFSVSDASWKEDKAGLAVGLLDRQNNKTEWFTKQVSASSTAEAKLLAIQWAMQLVREKGFRRDNLACDALAKWARENSQCNGYILREGSPIVIPNFLLQ
ncbi:uncharacterized protein LOC133030399 [Cannabis sativa]|uniref:uncharacterized protein LOC133030399 n=1 Tax=Cannabis sativa TaxID=3483 RepID=UPI0029CA454D|nr:uncharacterized protein LOC133030399 [Cannabis sativa]